MEDAKRRRQDYNKRWMSAARRLKKAGNADKGSSSSTSDSGSGIDDIQECVTNNMHSDHDESDHHNSTGDHADDSELDWDWDIIENHAVDLSSDSEADCDSESLPNDLSSWILRNKA